MAGQQGTSGVQDEMAPKDDFFATLDKEDTPTQTATAPLGTEFEQEADRLERGVIPTPDAVKVEAKSDANELLDVIKTQQDQINTLIEAQQSFKPVAQEATPKDQPKNLAEYLFGKDGAEDFVYDPEEAVSDPNSDSAKYHRAEIALETSKQIARDKASSAEETAQQQFETEKKQLMDEFKMTPAQFAKFEKDAATRTVTLKDVYLMMNRDEFAKNVAKNTVSTYANQRATMANISPALASSGGHELQAPTDSQFFGKLFGIDNSKFATTI